MRKVSLFLTLILLTGFYYTELKSQQLAFPGAEGFGKYATGGRGGRIVEVTSLKDMDKNGITLPGTLRQALSTTGTDPITIVFRVSGLIELKAELKSGRSNMTIAGQTAPGDGICVKNESIKLSGENLIVRYIRFRPGDELKGQASGLNIENSSNFIVDHCSMSWAIEENTGFYDNVNSTIQWCIISEGLYDSYHSKGPRGYGGQWGGQYTSFHHNLLAHNRSRSPRINGCRSHDTVALVDFRNNVIFNWGTAGAIYGGEVEINDPSALCHTNFVNNYYKPGPATSATHYFAAPSYVTDGNIAYGYGQYYFSGNIMEGDADLNANNWEGVNAGDVGGVDNIKSLTEFEVDSVYTETAIEANNSVLAYAGAIKPIRDSVDLRIVGEAKGELAVTGDGTIGTNKGIIDSQTAVGGWPTYNMPSADSIPADSDKDGMPDYWETENGLNPNDSLDGPVITGDGYSNLEHYLNSDIPYIKPGIPEDTTTAVVNRAIELNIYPNPVQGTLYFQNDLKIKHISIYNSLGKLIVKQEISAGMKSINLEKLVSGMYFLKATLEDGVIATQPFSKQ